MVTDSRDAEHRGGLEISSANPFGDFRTACETVLKASIAKLFSDIPMKALSLEIPPNPEFGQLASPVLFEMSKEIHGMPPRKLAEQAVASIEIEGSPIIKEVKAAGGGYINFHANFDELSRITIQSVRASGDAYGTIKTDKPKTIIVEHTSANPIHPIHIGTARNPILGDALARILAARGHKVRRHFYVDDVGRQTAVVAYGYEKLGKPEAEGKPDQFVGLIYTLTSCFVEIRRLERQIASEKHTATENAQIQQELDEWRTIADDLKAKHPKLFARLMQKVSKEADSGSTVNALNRSYEAGEENARRLVREVCQLSLGGIHETLARVGISFDSWDWESDFAWNSDVSKTLDALRESGYVYQEGPVLEFDANRVAEELKLKPALGIKEDYEIPSLTLVRADGTTLYTTRDIPYSVWKFTLADRVINVVGMEQTLPQQQLKLALWALGHTNQADNLTHYAHNLLALTEFKMSGRMGRYITFDEVIDEALKRAYEEVDRRSPQLTTEEKTRISEIVGVGALKYALIEVDPIKPVFFTWNRVLDFDRNSAPYVQYSHARARSILRKAKEMSSSPDFSLLKEGLEHDLVMALARFPEVFINAAENLKPHTIADYANTLADKFNSYYNAQPVIKAKPNQLAAARLSLVDAVSIVLKNSLGLIGIVAPERM